MMDVNLTYCDNYTAIPVCQVITVYTLVLYTVLRVIYISIKVKEDYPCQVMF